MAWLAIIAAATATTNIGQYNGSARQRKVITLLGIYAFVFQQ
jgi:hypothetical protein